MNKILLTLLFLAGISTANAQICTPDTSMKNSGMSPRNLPDGKTGFAYSEVIQFKFPKDTSFQGNKAPIDSVILIKVEGMPQGFTFQCNKNNRCAYLGGDNG